METTGAESVAESKYSDEYCIYVIATQRYRVRAHASKIAE